MSNIRWMIVLASVALLVIYADIGQFAGPGLSDYFQRHPELLQPANVMDLSGYFQRHPATLTMALNDRLHSLHSRAPSGAASASEGDGLVQLLPAPTSHADKSAQRPITFH